MDADSLGYVAFSAAGLPRHHISQATPDCMLKQVLIRNPQLKELRVNLADDRKVRLLNAC